MFLLSGSRDTGRVRGTEAGPWDSHELDSVKSVAGFVSSLRSEDNKFDLAQVCSV